MSGNNQQNCIKLAIESSFRHLVLERRYRSISIADICKEAHVSRNTFYAYYRNKDDLLASIIKQDAFATIEQFNDVFSLDELMDIKEVVYILTSKMYSGILENRDFYTELVGPMQGHNDAFFRAVVAVVCEFDKKLLAKCGYHGSAAQMDYIACFFAAGQAMTIEKWIVNGYDLSVSELSKLYNDLIYRFWLENVGGSLGSS